MRRVIGLEPNPIEMHINEVNMDMAYSYRLGSCPGLSSCLTIACLYDWEGFSCLACEVYKTFNVNKSTERIRKVTYERKSTNATRRRKATISAKT